MSDEDTGTYTLRVGDGVVGGVYGLDVEIEDFQLSSALADKLEEMADSGLTLTPDDLRDWAARLRKEVISS